MVTNNSSFVLSCITLYTSCPITLSVGTVSAYTVTVYSDTVPTDNVMGQDVYKVIHDKTKDELLVTIEDIEEA